MPRRFIQLGLKGGGPALCFNPDQLQPSSVLAFKIRASLHHTTVNLLLDSGFPRSDIILCLSHQVLPHLQPLEVKGALSGLQRQRLLTLLELRLVDGSPLQRHKGHLTQLHLLL